MRPRFVSRGIPSFAMLCLAAAPLAAQRTHDQSRLVIGVMGGWIGGRDLWSVQQPVNALGGAKDLFDVHRKLRSNITLGAQGTYFPGAHVGITGEATYLGIGTRDECTLINSTGDFVNEAACRSLNNNDRSASGVALMGGLTLRPWSRTLWQPYVRGLAGLSLVPRSTVELVAVFGQLQDGVLPIYIDAKSKEVKPTGAVAFGIATAPRAGYQLRIEARNTWVRLPVIVGPNPQENMPGNAKGKYQALPSITIGLDVVLEKRRGRRY